MPIIIFLVSFALSAFAVEKSWELKMKMRRSGEMYSLEGNAKKVKITEKECINKLKTLTNQIKKGQMDSEELKYTSVIIKSEHLVETNVSFVQTGWTDIYEFFCENKQKEIEENK